MGNNIAINCWQEKTTGLRVHIDNHSLFNRWWSTFNDQPSEATSHSQVDDCWTIMVHMLWLLICNHVRIHGDRSTLTFAWFLTTKWECKYQLTALTTGTRTIRVLDCAKHQPPQQPPWIVGETMRTAQGTPARDELIKLWFVAGKIDEFILSSWKAWF